MSFNTCLTSYCKGQPQCHHVCSPHNETVIRTLRTKKCTQTGSSTPSQPKVATPLWNPKEESSNYCCTAVSDAAAMSRKLVSYDAGLVKDCTGHKFDANESFIVIQSSSASICSQSNAKPHTRAVVSNTGSLIKTRRLNIFRM